MEIGVLIYLTSGLFLGWSLGANDAANVFGTAVGTRMIKFTTAALICTIFVILGAVISGAGAAHTLSKLGDVNALGGAFVAAFSAAAVVAWLTVLGLPVSTTQAIVGAIIGWNFFTGMATDFTVFKTIIGTWFISPVLTAFFSYFMYKGVMWFLNRQRLHIVRLDAMTRLALLIAGVLGSYSLGANNIANVMGVFIGANPFKDFSFGGLFVFTGLQQLFFVGGIAISVGIYTYGKKVMMTVGDSIAPLTPVGAFVVVIATSLVLFLFASEDLEFFLASLGLPTIPLVPVSSSQAVVGGVIGIAWIKNRRNIKWGVTGRIVVAWIQTPIVSALFSFVMLFIMQNLFGQSVFEKVEFQVSKPVLERHAKKLDVKSLESLVGKTYTTSGSLKAEVDRLLPVAEYKAVLTFVQEARMERLTVDPARFPELGKSGLLSQPQIDSVKALAGKTFDYRWQLVDALTTGSESWRMKEATVLNKPYNKEVKQRLDIVMDLYTAKMK
ncbi:MAG: inorganic phosphate transporter [Magnetococcales bacterium]|nr:inorganic phosphate transporter [Magnetococcales bacterium]